MDNISACLKKLLAAPPGGHAEPETGAEALAVVAFEAALKGNDKNFKLIRDMTEEAGPDDTSVTFFFSGAGEYAL